jgi:ectoine hydroxylase-related dioxygenase (phytanoyl-CoA dioxygenase family)
MQFVVGSHHDMATTSTRSVRASEMEIGDALIFYASSIHGASIGGIGEKRTSFDTRFNI